MFLKILVGIVSFILLYVAFWKLGAKTVWWYVRGDNKWREAFMGLFILQLIFTFIYASVATGIVLGALIHYSVI